MEISLSCRAARRCAAVLAPGVLLHLGPLPVAQTPVQSLEQLARQSRINYTVVEDSDTHSYFRNMKNAEDTLYRSAALGAPRVTEFDTPAVQPAISHAAVQQLAGCTACEGRILS